MTKLANGYSQHLNVFSLEKWLRESSVWQRSSNPLDNDRFRDLGFATAK